MKEGEDCWILRMWNKRTDTCSSLHTHETDSCVFWNKKWKLMWRDHVNSTQKRLSQTWRTFLWCFNHRATRTLQNCPKTTYLHNLKTWRRRLLFVMRGNRHVKVLCSHQVYCILFGEMTQFFALQTLLLRHSGDLTGKSTLHYSRQVTIPVITIIVHW